MRDHILGKPFQDLTGQKFNKLLVLELDTNHNDCRTKWICRCDCGKVISVRANNLKNGQIGCECSKDGHPKHGLVRHKLYNTWRGMKARCYNKNSVSFHNYGGRGIQVFHDWLSNPQAFIDYITNLPNYGLDNFTSLDRIDNDGNYEPGNLRWATPYTQTRNSRKSKLEPEDIVKIRDLFNDKISIAELARQFKVSETNISNIIKNKIWKAGTFDE